ncbi:MAG: hypothetical protein ACYC5V_00025 [Gemmatimonadaceae bacterium]
MAQAPKWFRPVGIVALLWNLLGCVAYLADVMMTPEAVAQLTAAQQAMYAARPSWAVAATAIAVWFGAAGCVGLLLRKRWATPLFITSLAALIVQNVWLFLISGVPQVNPVAAVLQACVLLIAIGLVLLGRKAAAQGWIV